MMVTRNIAMGFKHTLVLMLFFSLISVSKQGIAQDKLITLTLTDIPLHEALMQLTAKYGIKVAFDNAAVSPFRVSLKVKRAKPGDVVRLMLKNTPLEYRYFNGVFLITPGRKSNPVKPNRSGSGVGLIRDKKTGESLPYATVKVVESQVASSANADGFFSISPNTDDDSISIRVTYIGFEPIETKVARIDLESGPLVIELDRATLEKATPSRLQLAKQWYALSMVQTGLQPGELIVNRQSITHSLSVSGSDALSPLKLLPGVDGTIESLSGITVRHSTSDKNRITYDGFTIYHIDHFFGTISGLNSRAIKDIRIYRGGFNARWGESASSVIEITGKSGNEKQLKVEAGVDLLSADLCIEGPVGKHATFLFAARRSYTDYYRSDLYRNLFKSAGIDMFNSASSVTAFRPNPHDPVFYYYDANAKLTIKPTSLDVVSFSGYIGDDNLRYRNLNSSPFIHLKSGWGNRGGGIRWARQWGPSFYHSITLGDSEYNLDFQYYDSTMRKSTILVTPDTIITRNLSVFNHLHDITANIYLQYSLSRITLEGGLKANNVALTSNEQYLFRSNSNDILDTTFVRDFTSRTLTGWIQGTSRFGRVKALTLGVRVSYHNLTNSYYLEPRGQLTFELARGVNLKLAAGRYNQFVNKILQLGTGSYRNLWIASNGKKFPVVSASHLITGFSLKPTKLWRIDCEGYYKLTEGMVVMRKEFIRTHSVRIRQQNKLYRVDSRVLGVDFMVERLWSAGQVMVGYSLGRVFNRSDKLNGGDPYRALDDHLHELKLSVRHNLGRWTVFSTWIYGSAKPWEELLFTPTLQLSPDYRINSGSLPPYHRLDVGFTYSHPLRMGTIQLGMKLFNLYNRNNIQAKPYSISPTPVKDYLSGKSVVSYTEIPGLGFTPTFFLKVSL